MIQENVRKILDELPPGVQLEAAVKMCTITEVTEAIAAGVTVIGHNYVQEARSMAPAFAGKVEMHLIGHLQKNKVKKAVALFDLIETVDSLALAAEIDKRCRAIDKVMPVLIEVNSGREPQKNGVVPEQAEDVISELQQFANVQVRGLMTMGPFAGDPEDARKYFKETRILFDRLAAQPAYKESMQYLSMGMTNSYKVAVEEGANIVRIGTLIFGPR